MCISWCQAWALRDRADRGRADWLATSAPTQLGDMTGIALRSEEINGLAVSLQELASGLAACTP